MSVSIVPSQTISGDTFYRNKPFDIGFTTSGIVMDASISFINSSAGVLPYTSNERFVSSGISTVGTLGTLSVDAVASDTRAILPVTSASYFGAQGMCKDPSGNVYFAVGTQNKIFKLDPSGTVTTWAGTGAAGFANGNRLSATFTEPADIITNGSGTFYIGESYNIRKVDPTGTVTTLAGSTVGGFLDGTGSAARFQQRVILALQSNGNLYASDSFNHCIRNITPTGVVTTYAGWPTHEGYREGALLTTTSTSRISGIRAVVGNALYDTSTGGTRWQLSPFDTKFSTINTVASDSSGRLVYGGPITYDYNNSPVAVQLSIGEALSWGPGDQGEVNWDEVRTIIYNGSTRYVARLAGSPNLVYSADGFGWSNTTGVTQSCTTLAYGNGWWIASGADGVFRSTDGITWTQNTGVLGGAGFLQYGGGKWVGLYNNYDLVDGHYAEVWHSTDNCLTTTQNPTNISGQVFAMAYGPTYWIVGVRNEPNGYQFVSSADAVNWLPAGPYDLPATQDFSNVVALYYSQRASRWIASGNSDCNIITSTDAGATWSAQSNTLTPATAFVDVSGEITTGSYGATFSYPQGLLIDSNSDLIVAEHGNHVLRKISSTVSTYAGNGTIGDAPGTLINCQFGYPTHFATDSSGFIYVTDTFCNVVRQISNGSVSTYTGTFGVAGTTSGAPKYCTYDRVHGITFVGSNLYLSELNTGDIRKSSILPEVRPGATRVPSTATIFATSNYPITVRSRFATQWTSVGGVLPLYKYEPFSNTFTSYDPVSDDSLTYSTSSTELVGYLTGSGTTQVEFKAVNGATTAYSYPLTLVVRANSNGAVVDDISTSVTISTARLLYSPCNAELVYYRNEPIAPVTFSLVANSANSMYSATTLPIGLSLTTRVNAKSFALSGTPTSQSSRSPYSILAQDTSGRIYATQVFMTVNPERLLIDISGSTTQSTVVSNVPISPVTLTARFPPYSQYRSMQYTWTSPLPEGLQFRDVCGTALSGSSYAVESTFDPSFTLTFSGTITENQLRTYATAGTKTFSISAVGTRTYPLPSLSPSLPTTLTLTLGTAILLSSNVPPLFVGLPVSSTYYSARAYFGATDTSITNMWVSSGTIPDGLTGTFSALNQRFDFTGTPTNALPYSFTLNATNGSVTTSRPLSLTVNNDGAFIVGPTDSCFNFIQNRDLRTGKTGYYPSPIHYSVRSTSTCNVSLTASNLPAGVSLVQTPGGFDLSGLPTTPTALSTAVLTALVSATGSTTTLPVLYSVSADYIDLSDATLSFGQNVLSTPTQFQARSFSEQPILRYSSGNLPTQLTLTNTGILSGTVDGSAPSSLTIVAASGYLSGARSFPYTVTPDFVLLVPSAYSTTTSNRSVSIPITGYSVSGMTVSNYRFSEAFPYGLTINPTTGLLSGLLSASLPASIPFTLVGSAGLVDGSLNGTVVTTNLTINRAQMIHLRNLADLTLYASDDNGASWSSVYTQTGVLASSIGTNGSSVYLVPTSAGTVLRSTTGASYPTAIPMNDLSRTPYLSAVVNKTGTSTWWVAGSQSNVGSGTRSVYLFTSTNDGLTWNDGVQITTNEFVDRAGTPTPPSSTNPAYQNSVALVYKDGVLLLGGDQILRSVDDGATWSSVSSVLVEVADFSVEHETVWIAAGTDTYPARGTRTLLPVTVARTLLYSSDFGETWTTTAGDFNMAAYEVRYGNSVWLATGFDRDATTATGHVRVSYDGVNWAAISSIPSYTYTFGSYATLVNPPVGLYPIARDDEEWKVLRAPADGSVVLYTHSDGSPMTSGWTSQTITSQFLSVDSASRFYSYVAQTIDPGADITTITFPVPNPGPTFISPAQSTYVIWQYMPVPAITFTATGTAPISYLISALPVGLTWDSTTRKISGAPMRTGTQTFTVYAKNSVGITPFTVTIIVEVPRIVKQQTSAGAYTSLVRQYTEVNAAQNARDSRALPTESRPLGEFASPYPPSVVTPSNCPC